MKNIVLPIIKNLCPEVLANQLLSVQSMTAGCGDIFKLQVFDGPEPALVNGMLRHSFREGWQRYYEGEWINEGLWFKIKMKGL